MDARAGQIGEPRTYTITVQQMANGISNSVWLTNTLSAWLQIDVDSVSGGAAYDPATRQLTWAGTLPSGGSQVITYQAAPQGIMPAGFQIDNRLELHDGNNNLTFTRKAVSWVNAPEVVATLTAVPNQPLAPTTFTYTVGLQNVGLTAASEISTVVSLPNTFHIVTDPLTSTAGNPAVGARQLYWAG